MGSGRHRIVAPDRIEDLPMLWKAGPRHVTIGQAPQHQFRGQPGNRAEHRFQYRIVGGSSQRKVKGKICLHAIQQRILIPQLAKGMLHDAQVFVGTGISGQSRRLTLHYATTNDDVACGHLPSTQHIGQHGSGVRWVSCSNEGAPALLHRNQPTLAEHRQRLADS